MNMNNENFEIFTRKQAVLCAADIDFPNAAPKTLRCDAQELHEIVCKDLKEGLTELEVWYRHEEKMQKLADMYKPST